MKHKKLHFQILLGLSLAIIGLTSCSSVLENKPSYTESQESQSIHISTSSNEPKDTGQNNHTTSTTGSSALPSSQAESPALPSSQAESPTGSDYPALFVPDDRLSVYRKSCHLNFSLSETGIYCIAMEKSGSYALYCDAHSDEFIKLCGRTDCPHNIKSCDAYLDEGTTPPLGYYNGKIYYVKQSVQKLISDGEGAQTIELPASLWTMDPDGRNKQQLTYLYEEDLRSVGIGGICFSHGIVEFLLYATDGQGEVIMDRRFISLAQPSLPATSASSAQLSSVNEMNGSILNTDGEDILVWEENAQPGNHQPYQVYKWELENNTLIPIGGIPTGRGWVGSKTAYYMDHGIFTQWDYAKQEGKALLDPGISENADMTAFTDFLVMYDSQGLIREGKKPESVTLFFYDWNLNPLGECSLKLDPSTLHFGNYVFGETEDRILIIKDGFGDLPDYYIEKSDLGSGEIPLHEYHYPELDLSFGF